MEVSDIPESAHADGDEESVYEIHFCTLGMFIIDEIHFNPPTPPVKDVIGGAGSYAALGARLFSPPPASKTVGWVVDAGSDFPTSVRETITSWDTSCVLRETPERLTTRGWNGYGDGEKRDFMYLTPRLRLDHTALPESLVRSRSFHLICSPKRCIDLVRGISARRAELGSTHRPIFVWEPVPFDCTPEELPSCLEALKVVDVVSPNHHELAAFHGEGASATDSATGEVDREYVKRCSRIWQEDGIGEGGSGVIVVRAGRDGCYVANRHGLSRWYPAFHQGSDRVRDPTGGGNAFMGGLAVGLARSRHVSPLRDTEEAVIGATVAASFAIEQVGLPVLGREVPRRETWNGVHVQDRIEEYRCRLEDKVDDNQ